MSKKIRWMYSSVSAGILVLWMAVVASAAVADTPICTYTSTWLKSFSVTWAQATSATECFQITIPMAVASMEIRVTGHAGDAVELFVARGRQQTFDPVDKQTVIVGGAAGDGAARTIPVVQSVKPGETYTVAVSPAAGRSVHRLNKLEVNLVKEVKKSSIDMMKSSTTASTSRGEAVTMRASQGQTGYFSVQLATTELNTDRSGSDYGAFDLDVASADLCRIACEQDINCRAYTYVKPEVQGAKARCWLKSDVPQATPNACCVSGTMIEEWVSSECMPGYAEVALFADANYDGQCTIKGVGTYPNPEQMGFPNDALSSVLVGEGVRFRVFEHSHTSDSRSELLVNNDPNLSDNHIGNDTVSAFLVEAKYPYAVACLINRTDFLIPYSYMWGDTKWKSVTVEPGKSRWHVWPLEAGSVASPVFQISFDGDTRSGMQEKRYRLERYLASVESCWDGKVYEFRLVDSNELRLRIAN